MEKINSSKYNQLTAEQMHEITGGKFWGTETIDEKGYSLPGFDHTNTNSVTRRYVFWMTVRTRTEEDTDSQQGDLR